MGRGGGRGRGWCHRNCFHATGQTGRQRGLADGPWLAAWCPPVLSKEQEMAALKQQTESMEQALGEVKSRIQELGDTPSEGGTTTEP